MLTCAFTGHRRIPDEHKQILTDFVKISISHAYDLGYRRFIAGGALGFDTLAAREVIRFRMAHPDVELIIYVPYIGQESCWSPSQQDLYNFILASANEVRYLAENYDDGCLRRRNYAMAEACQLMIAYVSNPRSGSGQTLRMAESLGREVINLYSEI